MNIKKKPKNFTGKKLLLQAKQRFFTPADKIVKDIQNRYPDLLKQIKEDGQALADCKGKGAATPVAIGENGIQ